MQSFGHLGKKADSDIDSMLYSGRSLMLVADPTKQSSRRQLKESDRSVDNPEPILINSLRKKTSKQVTIMPDELTSVKLKRSRKPTFAPPQEHEERKSSDRIVFAHLNKS